MRIKPSVTSANLIALLALFIAIGGSAYAFHLGKNAVKTKNIKNAAVTEAKLADGAVSAAKLANGAVNSAKLGTGAIGAQNVGDIVLRTDTVPMPDATAPGGEAKCHSDERLLGGGVDLSTNALDVSTTGAFPSNAGGSIQNGASVGFGAELDGSFLNPSGGTGATSGTVYAFCLK